MRAELTLGFLTLLAVSAQARTVQELCGTSGYELAEEQAMHAALLRTPALKQQAGQRNAQARGRAAVRDVGRIVVMDGNEGIVSTRNLFNLTGRAVRFQPVAEGAAAYRFDSTMDIGFDAGLALAGTALPLGDDEAIGIDLPFAFPFFGANYGHAFVHSDGNVTFEQSDPTISGRTAPRVLTGPPRLSPLFVDLDPRYSLNGVRVTAEPERWTVTWLGVPLFGASTTSATHTFQLRIYPDGRVEFAYASVPSLTGVVGISPGRSKPGFEFVSFLDGTGREHGGAMVERFATAVEVDTTFAGQRFYQTHDDTYDYLVLMNDLGVPAATGAVAWASTLRNTATGFGRGVVDAGAALGSASRLQTLINMGPLSQYPADPSGPSTLRAGFSTLSVLAHEAGHRFLSFVSAPNPSGMGTPMLSTNAGHWSTAFNADASFMEGVRIRDDGPGANPRFTTTARLEGFSALDQYLMGLVPPSEVPPSFFVAGAAGLPVLPEVGIRFNGDRRDVAVEELVYLYGRRTPDHTVSQKHFRFAFVLIAGTGGPLPGSVAKAERLASEFEAYFARVTGNRAVAETTLGDNLSFSAGTGAGVVQGERFSMTVSVERVRDEALTVLLSAPRGALEVPASVVIPAGERSASFEALGRAAGVEDLTARATNTGYAVGRATVQVASARSALRLRLVSGGGQKVAVGSELPQPIVFAVVDENNLPYPGVAVTARVREGDTLATDTAVTDGQGRVSFRWAPGVIERRDMLAQVENGPEAWASVFAE